MQLTDIIKLGEKFLSNKNITNAKSEAKLIIFYVLKIKEYEYIINPHKIITNKELTKINTLLKERAKNKPFAYLVNNRDFYNLNFYVNKNVLIPRFETEHIIEKVLEKNNKDNHIKIIELGTGSGAILTTLLYHLPKAFGVGIDISSKALSVASKNINKYKLGDRCLLINGDWAKTIQKNYFDILICNPPYVIESHIYSLEKEVQFYEPLIALNGGKDGLESFRNLLPSARRCIKEGGIAFFEIGYDQSHNVRKLIKKNKFQINNIIKDLSHYDRILEVKAC